MRNILKSEYLNILYENGEYLGCFTDGQRSLWGNFSWRSGEFRDNFYSGEWKGGKLCGKGMLHFKDGKYYEGDFKGNVPEGKGDEYYPNGDIYTGHFKGGLKQGSG